MIVIKTVKNEDNVEYVESWRTLPKTMCVGATKQDGVYVFDTKEIKDTNFYKRFKEFYIKDGRLLRDYERAS